MFVTTAIIGAIVMSQRPEPQANAYLPAASYASVDVGRGKSQWKAFEQSVDLGAGAKVDLFLSDPNSEVLVAKGFSTHTEQGGIYTLGARITYTCKPLGNPAYAPMAVPFHILAHNEQGDRTGDANGLYVATEEGETVAFLVAFDGPFTADEVDGIEIHHDALSYGDGECEIRVRVEVIVTRVN